MNATLLPSPAAALADRTIVVALVGNPNAGKTSLFNALTGSRQKVGNYPGVTVERKAGRLALPDGRAVELIDLPGTYSLTPRSPDEAVTRDVVMGTAVSERRPDAIVAVVDATNLRNHLRFVLELRRLGLPLVVALNMADLAERDGTVIDVAKLSMILGLPVVPTVAVRKRGLDGLAAALVPVLAATPPPAEGVADITQLQREARVIAGAVVVQRGLTKRWTQRLDGVALHPVIGPLLLALLIFVMFQGVFTLAEAPMTWLADGVTWLQAQVTASLPDGALRSLLVDGVLGGVGAVVVFLPQILILFFFILVLEQSGYMTRAAFLMDRLMARVGLNGRAFIPLISSFACAIPGIMATRTIAEPRDRLTTILIAPLMTCSARLPVYAIVIAAFIPNTRVGGVLGLQGLVLFGLYIAGVGWRAGRRLGAAPHGDQGRDADVPDGDAQIPVARRARYLDRAVPACLGVPRARRQHHPDLDGGAVGAGDLAEAAHRLHRHRARIFGGGPHRHRARAGVPPDRLQQGDRARAGAGHGGA